MARWASSSAEASSSIAGWGTWRNSSSSRSRPSIRAVPRSSTRWLRTATTTGSNTACGRTGYTTYLPLRAERLGSGGCRRRSRRPSASAECQPVCNARELRLEPQHWRRPEGDPAVGAQPDRPGRLQRADRPAGLSPAGTSRLGYVAAQGVRSVPGVAVVRPQGGMNPDSIPFVSEHQGLLERSAVRESNDPAAVRLPSRRATSAGPAWRLAALRARRGVRPPCARPRARDRPAKAHRRSREGRTSSALKSACPRWRCLSLAESRGTTWPTGVAVAPRGWHRSLRAVRMLTK